MIFTKYRCKADVRNDGACLDAILWRTHEMEAVSYERLQALIRELLVVRIAFVVTPLGRSYHDGDNVDCGGL